MKSNYYFKHSNNINYQEFDSFVEKNGHLLQTSAWGKLKSKNGWHAEYIALYRGKEIVATCMILFRRLGALNYTLAYVPKGFVFIEKNEKVDTLMRDEIIKVAQQYKAVALDMEPNIARDDSIVAYFEKLGFKHQGFEADKFIYQTQFDMIVDLTKNEDIKDSFPKKNQKLLDKSIKEGLEFRKASIDEIDIFANLSDITSKRNNISLRKGSYYKQIVELFSESNNCDYFLVELNKETFKKEAEKKVKRMAKEIAGSEKRELNENAKVDLALKRKKLRSIEEDIKKLDGNKPIYLAGCLVLYCGDMAYYLYAASSNEFRYLQPNVFMNYYAMIEAKKRGCTGYNLGGYKSKDDGLYPFKLSLGADSKEFVGIFSYVINKPIYKILKKGLAIRSKLKKIKKSLRK